MTDFRLTFVTALVIFSRTLEFLILARIILSWIRLGRDNVVVRWIYNLTEPILAPIRNIIYKSPLGGPGMMLDFSPIIASFLIEGLMNILISFIL